MTGKIFKINASHPVVLLISLNDAYVLFINKNKIGMLLLSYECEGFLKSEYETGIDGKQRVQVA